MGRITGTKAADTLTGTPGNDTISGLAGADVIEGSAGDDLIEGGTGDDTISGGEGNDILKGGSGDDILTGNQGSDSVYGGEGQDSLYDSGIYNNAGGSDLLDGGEGDDRISIYRSSDESGTNITIFGGGGNDIIDISAGSISSSIMGTTIILDAGIGNDIINISGSGLNANITLGEGKDVLSILSILSILNLSGHGLNSEVIITDFVPGALGDRIEWTYGLPVTLNKWNNDSNPFGSGYARLLQNDGDTLLQIDPDGGANEYVTLIRFSNTMASAFTEFNFESYDPNGTMPTGQVFAGTTGNDTMIGTVSADTFQGGDGDDFIEARAGSDRILGGIGNDYIDGQLGDDWIDGGPGHDQIRGGYGNDVLIGGDGNDDIDDGGSLDDRIFGGSGDDILRVIYNFQGIVGKSYLNGGEGNDIIFFTIHNDSLVEIDAGDGNDTVSAEADSGTGIVRLGVGSDTLLLRDIYSPYGPWNGSISVEDFSVGVGGDKVVFSEAMRFWKGYVIGIDPFDLGYLRLVQFENRTILQIDRDGYSGEENYFENMVYFDNIDAREFVKYNFDGFVPKIVPASEAITADITAPVSVSEDGEKVLSLKLILSGNSYINGIISINIEEQSTTTINADVILKEKILGYDFVRSPSGSYGLTLPPISILSDFIAEGTETIAVTIRVSGQVFDTGTDTKTVLVKLIDSGQTGGPGEDRIGGTRFSDDLSGGQGNDRLSGNLGNDNIDGGSGIDTAVFGDFFKKSTVSAQSASVTVVGPDGTDITGLCRPEA
ncbi:calcium-binding protein, partial [Sphingomonas sp. Leaf22]|uniref:calcium-binding protein n=1 Tax=Sphingomonas sp. Leaf22 TaxID=1735687 RepID=UPI00138F32BC